MKGQKVCGRLLSLLLASAALSFGQWNGATGQISDNSSAASSEAVGPGTINYVEGQVSLDTQALTPQSVGKARLMAGQVLDTGDGYAEVLLTPGAFLRIGSGSEVRILSAGLANTRTELVHGTAIIEADQIIKGTDLSVSMDGSTTRIEKHGLYDFNAAEHAVRVLDGKATVQEDSGARTLGKHDQVLLASDNPLKKRSFSEKDVQDEPLYVWSKVRGEDEAQASASAARNADEYAGAGPGWFWDPAWNYYGFWPATAALYSPFGYGFYSPAFFGFGYYGGGYYGGYYPGLAIVRPGWHNHDWHHNWAGVHPNRGWHGGVSGMSARARVGAFRGGGFSHSMGGVHAMGGFHGGGFHGGGGRR